MDHSVQSLLIGLDVGGSSTELLAVEHHPQRSPVRLVGPGANLQRVGFEQTVAVLQEVIERALRHFPEASVLSVCAGIAGCGRPKDQELLARRLQQVLGDGGRSVQVRVVHDAEIALEAAFKGDSGVVVVAGTGSVILARTRQGQIEVVGGWGYLLGDEGSGFAIARAGLQAVTHAMDGGPPTRLRELLAERFLLSERDALIHRVYQEHWPLQEFAPVVLEAARDGDPIAQQIVEDQVARLVEQVSWLLGRLKGEVAPRMALAGGLMNEPFYVSCLREQLVRRWPGWSIEVQQQRPVEGALRLARRLLKANVGSECDD
ncbi:N-acetylglucosamine kinase [Rhodothermus profundi]|uniref:BadF-type ATPase n=1 Tax=Rhodothermus profundi TaxID=633813 RepID=A0A1M6R802_9BACT|nr:BadF/BadG/BcrA/BcrD ATPase family protein [Rhodothermus profundi]SHK28601.1 BadF-type ATPase [Rhodothermus profundi]